jgi:hypothetical protein
MPISKSATSHAERSQPAPAWQPRASRAIAIEALVGVTLTLGVLGLLRVPHVGLGTLRPHPIWLVVLVVAARYGARGVVIAGPIAWAALAIAGAPGKHILGALLAELAAPVELGALAATVLVGWVASAHERTAAATMERLRLMTARSKTDAAALAELRAAALALRARNDRLELSLTFLRDIARRLDGDDVEVAAQAALELATARLGARAGAVQVLPVRGGEGGDPERSPDALMPVAATGVWDWSATETTDATVTAALGTGRPVRAIELPNAGPTDSDLAAPIIVGRTADTPGVVMGAIALRGVPRGGADMAALRDLTVIAEWVSGAFAAAAAREAAVRTRTHSQSHPHSQRNA